MTNMAEGRWHDERRNAGRHLAPAAGGDQVADVAATPWGTGERRQAPARARRVDDQWTSHRWASLSPGDLVDMLNVPRRIGAGPDELADQFHVCRRRGSGSWGVMFGVLQMAEDGRTPAVVLGETIVRWHLIAVPPEYLPASVREATS